jgi:hypothetical protein
MAEDPVPPSPAPRIPQLPTTLSFEDEAARARRQGCLKWGLVGCAGASVLLIVALLFLLSNAKKLMGLAFDKVGEQVVSLTTPDVTPAQKEDFREKLRAFAESAKDGKVKPADVQAWQSTVMAAISKGRITPADLGELTRWLDVHSRSGAAGEPAPSPPPK